MPSSSSPAATSPSGSTAGQPSVAAIDPCAILKPADLTQFGTFEDGKPETLSDLRMCSWKVHLTHVGDPGYGVSVGVRDNAGINDGPTGQSADVNGRPAVQSADPAAGDCVIRLKMTDKTRVDVSVVGLVGTACDVAGKIAYIVEPRLPK